MTLSEPFFTEEDIFYHRLIKLKRSLKVIALSRLTIDHLDKMGIPKSHINYREKHKKYKNKKTEESEYSYTIATFSYNKQNFTLYKYIYCSLHKINDKVNKKLRYNLIKSLFSLFFTRPFFTIIF